MTFLLVLVVLAIVLRHQSVYYVQQAEVVIVERLGKFEKILQPGINFIFPIWRLLAECLGRSPKGNRWLNVFVCKREIKID